MPVKILVGGKGKELGADTDLHIAGVRRLGAEKVQIVLEKDPDISGLQHIWLAGDAGKDLPTVDQQYAEVVGHIGKAGVIGGPGIQYPVGHIDGEVRGGSPKMIADRFHNKVLLFLSLGV